ncbi:MAG TPA: division plane positioning ATPase MipZ [Alphaproteobacteria bacterium]|nr:division plane positioning ATPase MipZ [Alphaproteobacteria bacterium]
MAQKPYIIVLGNEKGGTGKSTVSMHVIVSLLRMGFSVGSIDVDARQGTLTRYTENRKTTSDTMNKPLPLSTHIPLLLSNKSLKEEATKEDQQNLEEAISKLASNRFIVIDTPGSDSSLSRAAHAIADTLITPLNDSFIDLDMLVRLKSDSLDILRPSTYAEMVWEQKKRRAIRDQGSIEWYVLRNRLSSINARNKEQMEDVIQALAKRIGFHYIPGFGERVIFRELFLKGITVLDLEDCKIPITLSHVSAKQELRNLIHRLQLPDVERLAA